MSKSMVLSGPMSALRSRFGDREAIRRMAKAGFDAVDYTFNEMVSDDCVWNTPRWEEYGKELLTLARDQGVFFNQAHAPFLFDWDHEWLTPAFETNILPKIHQSFRCAALLGIPRIVVHPIHHIRYRGNQAMLWDWNQEYYHRILELGKECGVQIALENMWQTDPLRGCGDSDVFSTPTEFRDFLDSLRDPWACACVDVGHAGLAGEDPAELLRTLGGGRVKAVHIHDNGHRADDHTLPYLGKLDLNAITSALGEIGYAGDFTFEVTNYLTPFDDALADQALAFQVTVGRHLIQKVQAARRGKEGQ